MTWLERTHTRHHDKCVPGRMHCDTMRSGQHQRNCYCRAQYIVSLACKYILSGSVIYRHRVVRCHYSCLTYSVCPSVCMQYNTMLLNGSSLHTSTLEFQVRLVIIFFQLVSMAVPQRLQLMIPVSSDVTLPSCEWLPTVENISHSDTTSHSTRPKFSSLRVVC